MDSFRSPLLRAASAAAGRLPDWIKSALYRLPVVAAGIRWLLTRAAPGEPVVVEVAAGIARGARLRLDLKTQKYYWLGTHELDVQQALAKEARPGMTVYDIGAHEGFYTLGLARRVGQDGRVYAFEPLPENARRLQENLEANRNLSGIVTVVEAAVTDLEGRLPFHRDVQSSQARLTTPGQDAGSELEVNSVTLDSFILGKEVRTPELLKLDVEGAEGRVLAGARRLLREIRPVWVIEVHNREAAQAVWNELQHAGYAVLTLDRKKRFREGSELAEKHVLASPE